MTGSPPSETSPSDAWIPIILLVVTVIADVAFIYALWASAR
jgi:hypothetical protein